MTDSSHARSKHSPPPLAPQEREDLLRAVRSSTPTQRLLALQRLMEFIRSNVGTAERP